MSTGHHRSDYIAAKHGVTAAAADEALADPSQVVIDPDPKSKSGRTARVIGWSQTAAAVLTVLVIEDEGTVYGGQRLEGQLD